MNQITTEQGLSLYKLDDSEVNSLLRLAEEASSNTYPKGSTGYSVSALAKSGKTYQGVSYKSDTRTLTMHSEMTALAHAAIHGDTEIVAITGPNCHMCKQLIYENSLRSGIDIVVVIKENEDIKQVPISTLMPYAWPEKPKETL